MRKKKEKRKRIVRMSKYDVIIIGGRTGEEFLQRMS